MSQFKKQPPEVFYRKSCSEEFCNIRRKTSVLESLFDSLAGFKTCNFLKKRLQQKCFPVNIAKFLKTLILIKICKQQLLPFMLFTVNISSERLVSALNSIGILRRSSSRFKEFSLECLVVCSSPIWKKEKLSAMVTRCHSLSLVFPLVGIRCDSLYHSLLLVIIWCTTCLSVYNRSIKPYVIWKKHGPYFIEIYINTEHKVQRKWVDKISLGKILETGWKKSAVVENTSLLTDLESCFTSLTQKRFQESWKNTNESSLQKISKHNFSSNADLASRGSCCLSSLF